MMIKIENIGILTIFQNIYIHEKNKKEMYFILLDEVQFAIKNDEIKNDNEIRLYGILNGLLRLDNVDIYIYI